MKQTGRRRLLALILAGALMVMMSITAFATGTTPGTSTPTTKGSITISNPQKDVQYYAYKIFDVTYATAGTQTSYSYSIAGNSDFITAVKNYTAGTETNGVITGKGLTLTKAAGSNTYTVNTDTGFSAADFATKMKAAAVTLGVAKGIQIGTGAGPAANGTYTPLTKGDIDLGYYLVVGYTSVGTPLETEALCSLTTTNPAVTIQDKNDTPFKKEIKKVNTEDVIGVDPSTGRSVKVGDTLTYTITGDIPNRAGAAKYYYHASDTMTKGLRFNKDVTITIGSTTVAITPETTGSIEDTTEGDKLWYRDAVTTGQEADQNGGGFDLSLDLMKKTGNNFTYADNAKIVITYTATVTEDSVKQIAENKAELKYGNDPDNLAKSTPQKVRTWSSKIEINKYEDNGSGAADLTKPLAGAKFVLKKGTGANAAYYKGTKADSSVITSTQTTPIATTDTADLAKVEWVTSADGADNKPVVPADLSTITVLTTGADGKAFFAGLENGVYSLIEVEAPAGYNLLQDPTKVEVFTVAQENPDGTVTAKTGAISDADKTTYGYTTGGFSIMNYTPQTVTAQVLNKSGSFLPSTGGIGTTVFYLVGGVLLVAAAVWFVVGRKKCNAALYSRRKEHFIFDRINTPTAHSFR